MADSNLKNCNDNSQGFIGVIWWLRIIIAVQCFGIAGRYLFASTESESDIYGLLFFDLEWPETTAKAIDDAGGYGCLVAGIVLIVTGLMSSLVFKAQPSNLAKFRFIDSLVLVFVTSWSVLLAVTEMIRGGLFAELALAEQAVRFATPASLFILIWSCGKTNGRPKRSIAVELLVVATVCTFVSHGYKALQAYGPFVDLILLSDQRVFQTGIEQQLAENLLIIIGWADIAVACLIILLRWKWVAVYMSVWGFLTAGSRVTALGMEAWPETVIRVANGGAPLVLFFMFRFNQLQKRSETRAVPPE